MPNSFHPTLDDVTINMARHESGHALTCHLMGYTVESVEVNTRADGCQGLTLSVGRMQPDEFAAAYQTSPIRAATALVGEVLITRAGSFCEVWGGNHGHNPEGHDLTRIEHWRQVALQCGYDAGRWNEVYAEAFSALGSWYRYQQVRECIHSMALALANLNGKVGQYAFLSLCEHLSVAHLPLPRVCGVLPPAKPATRPAARSQASSTPRPDYQSAGAALYIERPAHAQTGWLLARIERRGKSAVYAVARDNGEGGWHSQECGSLPAAEREWERRVRVA